MKRTLVFALCLLAVSGQVLADTSVQRRSITGKDVQNVLSDFISSISKELNSLSKPATRRLQGSVKESIHDFFADILGKDWSDYVPDAWKNSSFSWNALGTFEYSSNLQDFLSNTSLSSLVKPQNLGQLYDNLEALNDKFCSDKEFSKPELVPSTCAGPSVRVAYIPKKCIINEIAKQIICTSPRLVMIKTPGSCTHKHFTPASWTGKECKLAGQVGFEKEVLVGGANYTVPLFKLFESASAPSPLET